MFKQTWCKESLDGPRLPEFAHFWAGPCLEVVAAILVSRPRPKEPAGRPWFFAASRGLELDVQTWEGESPVFLLVSFSRTFGEVRQTRDPVSCLSCWRTSP